ncbi:MAG: hypothetical protein U0359_40820 [Byssovorax sp.]
MLTCHGDDSPAVETIVDRFHAGLSYGRFRTDLSFLSGSEASLRRDAVIATLDVRIDPQTTLSGSLGAGTSGLLITGGQRYEILPGAMIAGSFSRRLLDGRGAAPFLLFGITAAASTARIRAAAADTDPTPRAYGFHALDLRAGLTVGKTFAGVVSPYAAARLFGGPVFWQQRDRTLIGGDLYHYQLAAGLFASLPKKIDVFAEGAPFGERALTIGGGVSF